MDGHTDGQTDGWTDGQVDRLTHRQANQTNLELQHDA